MTLVLLGLRACVIAMAAFAIATQAAPGRAAITPLGSLGAPRDGAPRAASDLASFSYLYIEANEGGSSGGHAAIRMGGQVYHFQHRDGLLVLHRENTRAFLHAYALVANREIHASRVELPAADRDRLRAAFDRRLRTQTDQLEVLSALTADHDLLMLWRRAAASSDTAPVSPEIPALGYFASLDSADVDSSEGVVALRARLEARYGPEFAEVRRAEAMDRLEALARSDPAHWPAAPPSRRDEPPPFVRGWARRYVDAAAGLAALEVLGRGVGLRADAVIAPPGPAYTLTPEEAAKLRTAADELEARLLRLAGSPRGDWGTPFLAGLARLEAMHASLRRQRWVLLDVIPADAQRIPARVMAARRELGRAVVAAGHLDAGEARRAWLTGPDAGERGWTRIEDTVGRVHEFEQSLDEQRDLRWTRRILVPLRPARLPSSVPLPRVTDDRSMTRDLERVRERRRRYAAALEAHHGYELLSRNCVSEIFATINAGLGDSQATSRRVLGGYIDGTSAFRFIPFVSAAAVEDEYRVVERRVVPSYRTRALARMRANENDLWVALRESNTLTSRSYQRGSLDSFFLFFTQDSAMVRPPLGALNLAAGVGETIWGVPRLPIDGGATFVSGLGGTLMSLPELVFFNIRKGSNDWVTPDHTPAP